MREASPPVVARDLEIMHSAPCFRGTRRQSHPGRGAQQMAEPLLEAFAQLQRREPEIEAR
jgi:hypothetical protein